MHVCDYKVLHARVCGVFNELCPIGMLVIVENVILQGEKKLSHSSPFLRYQSSATF